MKTLKPEAIFTFIYTHPSLNIWAASMVVLSMWPSKIKMDEEKSKHANLAQQNGLGPTFFHRRMLKLGERHSRAQWIWSDCHEEECKKWDLIIDHSLRDSPNHNDWSSWFAIGSLPPICNPNFSFVSEIGKEKKTKKKTKELGLWEICFLGWVVRNIFTGSHYTYSPLVALSWLHPNWKWSSLQQWAKTWTLSKSEDTTHLRQGRQQYIYCPWSNSWIIVDKGKYMSWKCWTRDWLEACWSHWSWCVCQIWFCMNKLDCLARENLWMLDHNLCHQIQWTTILPFCDKTLYFQCEDGNLK